MNGGFVKGFREYGLTISAIITTALLLIVYIFGVGTTSLIAKISGRRFLSKNGEWEKIQQGKPNIENFYRQF
jgi:cytochrome c biogenesis protein CcdA